MTFRVGDRVMIATDSCYYDADGGSDNPPNTVGDVIRVDCPWGEDEDEWEPEHNIFVYWPCGDNYYRFFDLVRAL